MSAQKLPNLAKPLFKNMLEKQQISYRMQMHKQKIQNVNKTKTKTKFYQQLEFNPYLTYRTLVNQNPKKNLMLQTKYQQIERQNKFLFQKIKNAQSPKSKKYKKSKKHKSCRSMQKNKSMNLIVRKKQIQEIQIENVRILDRITRQKPSMSFYKAEKDYVRTRNLSQKLSKIQKYRLQDWY